MLVAKFEKHPLRSNFPPFAGFRETESSSYYGKGYQDVEHRKPSIRNAQRLLKWTPAVELEQSVEETLDFFLREAVKADEFQVDSEILNNPIPPLPFPDDRKSSKLHMFHTDSPIEENENA